MRITIGGALLFASAGGMAVLGPLKSMGPSVVRDQINGLEQSITWVESYFKGSQPVEASPINLPVTETHVEPAPVVPVAVEPATVPKVEAPIEAPAPVVEAAAPTPVVKTVARRRHRRKVVATAAAAETVSVPVDAPVAQKKKGAKAAAKKSAGMEMVGLYVALQLKSGREVKGVLKEKTDTQYTIELPGMGPFQYPVSNVLGIKPVE